MALNWCGLEAENRIETNDFSRFKEESFYFSGKLKVRQTIVKEDDVTKLLDALFKQFAIKSLNFNLIRRFAIRTPYDALLIASLLTLEAMLPYLKGRTLETARKLLNNKEVEEFIQDNLYKYSWLNRAINKRAVSELLEEMKKYGIEFENIRDAYKFAHMSSLYMISVRGETQTDKIIDTVIKIDQKLNKLFSDLTFWTFASIGLKKYEQLDKYLSALMIKNSYADLLPDPIIDKVAFLYAKEREKELKNFEINLTRIWEQLKESAITGELEISLIADYASGKIGELSLALLARASTILALMFPEGSLMRIGARILGILARSFAVKLGVSLYIEWKLDGWLQEKLSELLKYIPPFSDLHIAEEEKVKSDFRLAYNNAFYLVACDEGIDWACKVVNKLGLNENEIVELLKPYGDKAIKNLLAWINKLRLKLKASRLKYEELKRKREKLQEIRNIVKVVFPRQFRNDIKLLSQDPSSDNIKKVAVNLISQATELSKELGLTSSSFLRAIEKVQNSKLGTNYNEAGSLDVFAPFFRRDDSICENGVECAYYPLNFPLKTYTSYDDSEKLSVITCDGIYKKYARDYGDYRYFTPAGVSFFIGEKSHNSKYWSYKEISSEFYIGIHEGALKVLPSPQNDFYFDDLSKGFTIHMLYSYNYDLTRYFYEFYHFDALAKIIIPAFSPKFRILSVSFSKKRSALIISTTEGNFIYYICKGLNFSSFYHLQIDYDFSLRSHLTYSLSANLDGWYCPPSALNSVYRPINISHKSRYNHELIISADLSVADDLTIRFSFSKSEEVDLSSYSFYIDAYYSISIDPDGNVLFHSEYFYSYP